MGACRTRRAAVRRPLSYVPTGGPRICRRLNPAATARSPPTGIESDASRCRSRLARPRSCADPESRSSACHVRWQSPRATPGALLGKPQHLCCGARPARQLAPGVEGVTGMSGIRFGVFDHIEHLPGTPLYRLYEDRLQLMQALDDAGFFAYHLAEHHTPAVHSMAPSQNVFLSAAAQRTKRLRFGPGVYVLPLHHPLRLIEEVSMLDHLSGGRLELGVGRGGVLEAYFWGQEGDEETNRQRYDETLEVLRRGLSHDQLDFK